MTMSSSEEAPPGRLIVCAIPSCGRRFEGIDLAFNFEVAQMHAAAAQWADRLGTTIPLSQNHWSAGLEWSVAAPYSTESSPK